MGLSTRFWIPDRRSLSSDTESRSSSILPTDFPSFVVVDFAPEKNVHIFTESAAVPWVLVCAAAKARSFLDGLVLALDVFFPVKKQNVSIICIQKLTATNCRCFCSFFLKWLPMVNWAAEISLTGDRRKSNSYLSMTFTTSVTWTADCVLCSVAQPFNVYSFSSSPSNRLKEISDWLSYI